MLWTNFGGGIVWPFYLLPLPYLSGKMHCIHCPATWRSIDFDLYKKLKYFGDSAYASQVTLFFRLLEKTALWFLVSLCNQWHSLRWRRRNLITNPRDHPFRKKNNNNKRKRRLRLDREYRLWLWVVSNIHLLGRLCRVLKVFAKSKCIFLFPKCGKLFA